MLIRLVEFNVLYSETAFPVIFELENIIEIIKQDIAIIMNLFDFLARLFFTIFRILEFYYLNSYRIILDI